MPKYTYSCNKCEYTFTVTKSMMDETVPDCLKCTSNDNVNRVWGYINLGGMFKGSGSSSGCGTCSSNSCSTCCK
ncbi:MAG: FmdB family zinc ribbon protein [Cyanobacteriota bacterium]